MAISLPYKLREGQIAYAAKVMANLEALLNAFNRAAIDGLGEGDVVTLLGLLYKAAVLANEEGNSGQIVFPDGETLEQKFNAGNLNASLIGSDGLFYFKLATEADAGEGLTAGHLYVYAAESIDEDDFSIDANSGHLLYRLDDPKANREVHVYDLGRVRGDAGPAGPGNMASSVYDPAGLKRDVNHYTGYFNLPAAAWGGWYCTYDRVFEDGKLYYLAVPEAYRPAVGLETGDPLPERTYYERLPGGAFYYTFDRTVQQGKTYYVHIDEAEPFVEAAGMVIGAEIPVNTYYEKLPDTDCLLTDDFHTSGPGLQGHITATSGHAIIAPDMAGSDEAKRAWYRASVAAVGQGNGLDTAGAENSGPWIRIRALGIIPEEGIPLTVTTHQ